MSTPAPTTPSTALSAAAAARIPRILACVLCQTRKIKCDRNSPCSNCVKAGVTCIPSTPAPARKRRRPNQDLQQRLARCEELLSEYASAKPPTSRTDPAPSDGAWKNHGSLIFDDAGSVKFVDSYLWGNIHNELQGMREILDDDCKDEFGSCTPTDTASSPDQNASLLFGGTPGVNVEDVYPDPAHVFLLWQTFLDRVNPITKIIHVPTLQPTLLQAATKRENLDRNMEALLFAIFLMAAISLSEEESLTLLGYPKDQAIQRFSSGVRIVLSRIGILKAYDIVVLQALVLYMTSLSGRYDRHASWIMNGVVIRIAQKMGLHRDGESLGLNVFDAEMRRRIWWQIVMLDSSYALLSGLGQNMLPRVWDTKEPSNLDDSDLFPSMTSIQPREGPTDMVFPLVIYQMSKVLIDCPELEHVILQNERAFNYVPHAAEVEKAKMRIDLLDQDMTAVLEKYCDSSVSPVHEFASALKPAILEKIREIITPPREQPEWGTEIHSPQDNVFKLSVTTNEHNLLIYQATEKNNNFRWYLFTHFQMEVLIFMVGQLSTRTTGQLVDRAWRVLEMLYVYHYELYDMSYKAHIGLASYALRGWKRRAKTVQEKTGTSPEAPEFLVRLASQLGADDPRNLVSTESSPNPPKQEEFAQQPFTQLQPSMGYPWDQYPGMGDLGSFDWDLFASGSQGPVGFGPWQAQQPGGSGDNNWM